MKIYIGSDRVGFNLKNTILRYLEGKGNQVIDSGPYECMSVSYPKVAVEVSNCVVNNKHSMGILVCSSGVGMAMAANKITGIRAANCTSSTLAICSRSHNNANILCLGSSETSEDSALMIVDIFLSTEFEGGKHAERVEFMNNM